MKGMNMGGSEGFHVGAEGGEEGDTRGAIRPSKIRTGVARGQATS